jgi:hypothetical protein
MPVQKLISKRTPSLPPDIVTLIMDDSGSTTVATRESADRLLMTMQSWIPGAGGSPYFLDLAQFGTAVPHRRGCQTGRMSHLNKPAFGDNGMAGAKVRAVPSLHKAFVDCNGYSGEACPDPLALFFSDGETGPDASVSVDVVAIGIGMDQKDFAIMEAIAWRPGPIVNVDPQEVREFVADAVRLCRAA